MNKLLSPGRIEVESYTALNVRSQDDEMEKFFGEEYLKYRKDTPEFFPIPFKK